MPDPELRLTGTPGGDSSSPPGAVVIPLPTPAFAKTLTTCIHNARNSIYFSVYAATAPQFAKTHPLKQIYTALFEAARRGVTIQAYFNANKAPKVIRHRNLLTANALQLAGATVYRFEKTKILHAKAWVIDHSTTIIGSHNLTDASLTTSTELSILVRNSPEPHALGTWFNSLFLSSELHTRYTHGRD